MARHFDPRMILRQVSNHLLKACFERLGCLRELPWKDLKKRQIEPVFDAWQALPEKPRRAVHSALYGVHELATEQGMRVLVSELNYRCPTLIDEFESITSRADRAMWVYLNAPSAFDEAAVFARADSLKSGRYWIKRSDVPKQRIEFDDGLKARLEVALVAFYVPLQARGHKCKIEYYKRSGDAHYFFAYLDDYPDAPMVLGENGDFRRQPGLYAFDNVFVYSDAEGSLDMYAQCDRPTRIALQSTFCKALLGTDLGPDSKAPAAYSLSPLLNSDFTLPTEPSDGIARAKVLKLRVEPVDGRRRRITLEADPEAPGYDIQRMINSYVVNKDRPISSFVATQARFQIEFMPDGNRRPKKLFIEISCPSSCDLKSKPEELRLIGERCLKRWGIMP